MKKAPNPTGKGGFGDHPENRASGFWSKENSVPYWQKNFLKMSYEEFENWLKNNPEHTTAQRIAHESITKRGKNFKYHKDLIDRTSGTPTQHIEQNTTVDLGESIIKELKVNITGNPKYIVEGD